MKWMEMDSQMEYAGTHAEATAVAGADAVLDRRRFFRKAGMFGLGATVSALALKGTPARAQANAAQTQDTFAEMLTAFLIAEDLATTFYYNGLIGGVITDPNLAGPGGSAKNVTSAGNFGNVNYLQAALIEEIEHANFFRDLLKKSAADAAADPYTTFYFPAGTFATLSSFLGILNALENAFIGAYLNLVQELTYKATQAAAGLLTGNDATYTAKQYQLYAKIAGSILGVESEHRVLGRVIGNNNPANNLNYEQTDGLTSIFNGSASAVVALTPFLAASANFSEAASLDVALANWRAVTPKTGTMGPLPI